MKNILLLTLFTLIFCWSVFSNGASMPEKYLQNENSSAVLKDIFTETKARLDLS